MLPGKRNYTRPISKTRQHWQQQVGGCQTILLPRRLTSESGVCYSTTTSHIRSAWKKFHELIAIVCNKSFSLANCKHIFNSCVRSVLLYTCKTWPLYVKHLLRLSKVDNSMVRWICSVKIPSVQEHIQLCHLTWFGHLTIMNIGHLPKIMLNYNVAGAYLKSHPKKI